MDREFPLCQAPVGEAQAASCAACCGMYNWQGFNREMVQEILARQTKLFKEWDGTGEGIRMIKEELSVPRPQPLCPMIHNCEFMGFMDDDQTRVGCLLHPERNSGRNLREFSKHGRETCDTSRCTAYQYLSPDMAQCVAMAVPDWYLYGLCITDIDLVKSFFDAASDRLGKTISPAEVKASPLLLELFREYLCLKEGWPYARDPFRFGKYIFPDKTFRVARIDYKALGCKDSRHDNILLSLGSSFLCREEVIEAELMIEGKVNRFAEAYANERGL